MVTDKDSLLKELKSRFGDVNLDFSKFEYKGAKIKSTVICPIHGEFQICSNYLLSGEGCPKCGAERVKKKLTKTNEEFINDLKIIYGDKYDYSKVNYKKYNSLIELKCPIHGTFYKKANYLMQGHACNKCGYTNTRIKQIMPFEKIVQKIKKLHSNCEIDKTQPYTNTHTKITIKCEKGHTFKMTPNMIISCHQWCPICGNKNKGKNKKHDLQWLIEESQKIHGDKYTFEKFVYKNTKTKSVATCKFHGDFIISPEKLIFSKHGCPKCTASHLEEEISSFLKEKEVRFEFQKTFKWLKRGKGVQRLDFYLPDYKTAIECQGEQHFRPVRFGGISLEEAKKNLLNMQALDCRKHELCKKNDIKLLYFKNGDSKEELYKKIVEEHKK